MLSINRANNANGTPIDAFMCFTPINPATQKDYIDALLGSCAPNLDVSIPAPELPFFIVKNDNKKDETLSMMTTFFLAHLTINILSRYLLTLKREKVRQNYGYT